MLNTSKSKTDNDLIETNVNKMMRESYETHALDEVPKLTNIKALIAYDYFKYGWEAATRLYTQPHPDSKIEFTEKDFNLTNLQLAVIMGLTGTDKQKQEAREFLRFFINRN